MERKFGQAPQVAYATVEDCVKQIDAGHMLVLAYANRRIWARGLHNADTEIHHVPGYQKQTLDGLWVKGELGNTIKTFQTWCTSFWMRTSSYAEEWILGMDYPCMPWQGQIMFRGWRVVLRTFGQYDAATHDVFWYPIAP